MIPDTPRRAGPYAADGGTTSFPFGFKVFDASDIAVKSTSVDGIETELDSGFTVTLNPDQDNSPGGTVDFSTAPADGVKITILGALDAYQPMQLTNGGGFFPTVLNDSADRAIILIQQLEEESGRAIKAPASDGLEAPTLPSAASRKGGLLGFDDTEGNFAVYPKDGFTGPQGPPGPQGYTVNTLADLKAADVTNAALMFDNAVFTWTEGDYSALVDDDAANVIESDDVASTTGAWVRQTSGNIFRPLAVNIGLLRGSGDVIETAGYSTAGVGGARYLRLIGTGFTATEWRWQNADGVWYELDRNFVVLTHFGAVSGADCTDACNAAFAWLNEQDGRRLIIPYGDFLFSDDLRLTNGKTVIEGLGERGRLHGVGGASIILGTWVGLDPSNTTSEQTKTSEGKIVDVTLKNFKLQPSGDHDGSILIAENVDQTYLDHMTITGDVTAGSGTRTVGVETRGVQWFYVDNCNINVSGHAIWIRLFESTAENEDHFRFQNSIIDIGKNAYNVGDTPSPPPSHIRIDKYDGRAAPIWHFDCGPQNHFGRFAVAIPEVRGIHMINYATSDQTVVINPNICGCWFEYTDYPIDTVTSSNGAIIVDGTMNNCKSLSAEAAITGSTYSKAFWSMSGNHFEQGVSIATGIACLFTGRNSYYSMSNPFPTEAITRYRYWNKMNGYAMSGLRLYQSGTATISSGATSVVVPLSLAVAPDRFTVNVLLGGWDFSGWRVGGISASSMTIVFNSAAPSNANIAWSAEVSEI